MPRQPAHQANALRKKKKNSKAPETVDEYLQVGVELEESGERWRSGDVLKAGRFFQHAIEAYETMLQKFPASFDAKYNRARLLYYLTQLPLPPSFFPPSSTPISRLTIAESVHRDCLSLSPEVADVLFNYGQLLSDLGEAYIAANDESAALKSLENSITSFQKCLVVQEREYKASEALAQEAVQDADLDVEMGSAETGGVSLSGGGSPLERVSSGSSSDTSSGQWAAIVEPTTKDTLLDTALAELEVLTTLTTLSLINLAQLHAAADKLLADYILPLASALAPDRYNESILARANFLVAFAEGTYKSSPSPTNLTAWVTAITTSFPMELTSQSWQALCDRSSAYSTLATTDTTNTWKHLSSSASDLSAATKIAPEKNHPEIYLARGNTDLLRSRLDIDNAVKNHALLRKNAMVYYRSATNTGLSGFIGALESARDVVTEAKVKEAVVKYEDGDKEAFRELVKAGVSPDVVKGVVRIGVEEGLWTKEVLLA